MNVSRKSFFTLLIIAIALGGLPACSAQPESGLHMMPMDQMPREVRSAPVSVQEAYQFAAANAHVMENIPCYCGCGNIGHASNYACYVSHADDSGEIMFDNHALGCSICVDITQDVMRILREGKSAEEARAYIDAAYSKYGPSNIP